MVSFHSHRYAMNGRQILWLNAIIAAQLTGTVFTITASTRTEAQGRISSADTELLLAGGEQTVFTATKKAQKISDVPSAVTIITERDIIASGAVTLLDLLRSAPGVDVMEANRSVADVSIRGFNTVSSNKLLVMVDGRSIYSNVYGNVYWHTEPVLISRIKRIEIIRGAGSALYGANAFNGVINIITKTPAEMAVAPAKTAIRSLLGEQRSTYSEMQTSGGRPSDWTYSFGAGYNRSDGFGERKTGLIRDSYTVPILTADVEKRLKRGTLLLSAGNSDATSDYNETLTFQDAKFDTSFASLTYNEDQAKNPILARVYVNIFRLSDSGVRAATATTYDAEVQQSRTVSAAHSLVYGMSYSYAHASTFATGTLDHAEQLFALYAQDDFRFGPRTHLFAGVRLDDHSLYGIQLTPRISLLHHLPNLQTLRLSYGTSFRNPSLANTFLNFTLPIAPGLKSVVLGNENLKPEKVSSLELGYRKEIRGGYVGVNLFANKLSGLIVTVPTAFAPPPFPAGIPISSTFRNAQSASAVGLELESEFRIARSLRGLANYAYQDVENDNGSRVDYSPQHKVNLGIQANLPNHLDAYLGLHFVGSSTYGSPAGLQTSQAYARVDARLAYRFGTAKRPWTLSAIATNLFDDKHLEGPAVSTQGAATQSTPQRRTLYLMAGGKF